MMVAAVDSTPRAASDSGVDHHAKGLAEQEIADQHARLVTPQHARGELAAAHVALVDDVVVQQRSRVHEFDGSGEQDMVLALVAGHLRRAKRQHRPQSLAAGIDQVAGDLGNKIDMRTGLRQDQPVDPLHIGANKLDQRLDAAPAASTFDWNDDSRQLRRFPVPVHWLKI